MTEGVHARHRGGREKEKKRRWGAWHRQVDHWEKEIQRAEEEAVGCLGSMLIFLHPALTLYLHAVIVSHLSVSLNNIWKWSVPQSGINWLSAFIIKTMPQHAACVLSSINFRLLLSFAHYAFATANESVADLPSLPHGVATSFCVMRDLRSRALCWGGVANY